MSEEKTILGISAAALLVLGKIVMKSAVVGATVKGAAVVGAMEVGASVARHIPKEVYFSAKAASVVNSSMSSRSSNTSNHSSFNVCERYEDGPAHRHRNCLQIHSAEYINHCMTDWSLPGDRNRCIRHFSQSLSDGAKT